jgi:WD40 repeat protein
MAMKATPVRRLTTAMIATACIVVIHSAVAPGHASAQAVGQPIASKSQQRRSLKGHTSVVHSVAFSPDSKRLVTGGLDHTVRVWDADAGSELLILRGHTSGIWCVAVDPQGRWIASASIDATVKIWELESGRFLRTLEGHKDRVYGVCFSPDSKWVASGSWDKTVKVWDVLTGNEVLTLAGHPSPVFGVAFSPDGKSLASCSVDIGKLKIPGEVRIWDLATHGELLKLGGDTKGTWSVVFSPKGASLASVNGEGVIRLRDTKSGREIRTFRAGPVSEIIETIAFSPDGNLLAAPGSPETAPWSQKTVKIWSTSTGNEVLSQKASTRILSLAFNPTGTRLAWAGLDHVVEVCDVQLPVER